jgi:MFS family permease
MRRGTNLTTYFASFLSAEGARQILFVSVAWSVYQVHHQAFDLGLVGLAMFLPSLALVLVTGHVADHVDRKRTLMLTNLLLAGLTVVLAVVVRFAAHDLWAILTLVVAVGVVRAFGSPLESTILVSLVDSDDYVSAQARYNSMRELVVICSPAAGGALVAIAPSLGYVVAGAAIVVATGFLSLVRVPPLPAARGPQRFSFRTAFEGVRFIRSRPIVLGAISLDLFAVLFGGATALLPIYADAVLHVGPVGFGVLRGASGVGASLTALYLSNHGPKRRVGRTLLLTVAGYGIAVIVFAFSRTLWLSVAALAAAGAFDMVSVVIRRGLVQLNTPDAMRGRVNAVEMVFIGASSQLGAFESGTVAQLIGTVPSVAFGGLATLAIVTIWSVAFPELRRSDELVTAHA